MSEPGDGSFSWRANISGSADDPEELDAILHIVNGLCVVFGAVGLWISDKPPAGAKALPLP